MGVGRAGLWNDLYCQNAGWDDASDSEFVLRTDDYGGTFFIPNQDGTLQGCCNGAYSKKTRLPDHVK